MGETQVNLKEVMQKGLMVKVKWDCTSEIGVVTNFTENMCTIELRNPKGTIPLFYDDAAKFITVLTNWKGSLAISKRNIFGKYTFKPKKR